ncbi:hypothetical protein [Bradyrhizobium sp.]|uniref:hypothetical protein n=1 Tax=Bradyrhizobium sp. TaxID=376 RepID=UPI001ECEA3D7|nr:hypothetical protein [Bradyrhizobium sp.]MBV9984955.1 hypothetical protein [Bradyrhizobium sp.]
MKRLRAATPIRMRTDRIDDPRFRGEARPHVADAAIADIPEESRDVVVRDRNAGRRRQSLETVGVSLQRAPVRKSVLTRQGKVHVGESGVAAGSTPFAELVLCGFSEPGKAHA